MLSFPSLAWEHASTKLCFVELNVWLAKQSLAEVRYEAGAS